MEKTCIFCDKPFQVDTSRRNWGHVKFCSDECRKGALAAAKRAEYTPKPPQRKDCLQCGGSFLPARSASNKQMFCTRACFLKHRAAQAHEIWSDKVREKTCEHCGATFVPKKFGGGRQIYCTPACQVKAINGRKPRHQRSIKYQREFKIMKPLIIERDRKCVVCGSVNRLHVHHWDNSGQFPHCDNSMENLAALCIRCHHDIHTVTLAKVNGKWALDGPIFKKLGLTEPIPIR